MVCAIDASLCALAYRTAAVQLAQDRLLVRTYPSTGMPPVPSPRTFSVTSLVCGYALPSTRNVTGSLSNYNGVYVLPSCSLCDRTGVSE